MEQHSTSQLDQKKRAGRRGSLSMYIENVQNGTGNYCRTMKYYIAKYPNGKRNAIACTNKRTTGQDILNNHTTKSKPTMSTFDGTCTHGRMSN